jgi:hypothetical protein
MLVWSLRRRTSGSAFAVPVPKKGERSVMGLPHKDGVAWGNGNAEGARLSKG